MTEVQHENIVKLNYYTEWMSDEYLLNRREYEKRINMKNLRVYNNFPSVYHMLNSDKWMEG